MLHIYYSSILFFLSFIILTKTNLTSNFMSKKSELFDYYLKISKSRLKISLHRFNNCINHFSITDCMKKNNEIHSFLKVTTTNFINNFSNGIGNYNILIHPKFITKVNNLIIVPTAPSELIARIAIRSTWKSVKQTIKGRKLDHFFYMGKPEKSNNSYPISILLDEAKRYNDILLFDVENSYIKCTLLLLLCYKYIVDNFPYLRYLIRVNSDMILYPQKLDKMLDINKDVIGYKTAQMGIEYLSGSFYILKRNYLKLVINESKNIIPISFYDDIFCGQINKKTNFSKIAFINRNNYYIPLSKKNQYLLLNKSSPVIGAHSVNSDAILFLWIYNGYNIQNDYL